MEFHCIQLSSQIHRDTPVGACDNVVYYLVMHAYMKPDSTVDTLWVLHETTLFYHGHFNALPL